MAFEREVIPIHDLLTGTSLDGEPSEKVRTEHPSLRHIWGGM